MLRFDPDHHVNLRDGRFDGTTAGDVDLALGHWAQTPVATPLVVHFHGGLVTTAAGLETAAALGPEYAAAGGWPLFVLWESGWWDALRGGLAEVAGRPLFQVLLRRLAAWLGWWVAPPAAMGAGAQQPALDLAAAVEWLGRMPAAPGPVPLAAMGVTADALVRELRGDPEFRRAVAAEAAPDGGRMGLSALVLSAAVRAGQVARRVHTRLSTGRGHGAHATVVEELLREFFLGEVGHGLWAAMQASAAQAYADAGGGTALLHGLAAVWRQQPRRRVVLVGHSAGAISICHLLQHAACLPVGARCDVALLAPACTCELFADTLTAAAQRLAGFRLFGLVDALERADALLPGQAWCYPASLLYFVSGVCEAEADTPLLGLERCHREPTLAPLPGVAAAHGFVAGEPGRAVWAVAAGDGADGLACNATHHVQFDDLSTDDGARQTTIDSLRHIVAHGC